MESDNKKTLTLDDINITCYKHNITYHCTENCSKCYKPKKIINETLKQQTETIDYKMDKEYIIALKIIEKMEEFKNITCKLVDIGKNKEDEKNIHVLEIRGKKRKYKSFLKDDVEKIYRLDSPEDYNKMKEIYEKIDEYKDILIEGYNKYKISQLKFILSSEYRNEIYDFELQDFKLIVKSHCIRKVKNEITTGTILSLVCGLLLLLL